MFLHFSWKYVENEMIPAAAQKAFYNCASMFTKKSSTKGPTLLLGSKHFRPHLVCDLKMFLHDLVGKMSNIRACGLS